MFVMFFFFVNPHLTKTKEREWKVDRQRTAMRIEKEKVA